jgi:AraC-like DNA-binding protein
MPAASSLQSVPAFVSRQVTDAQRFYLNLKPRVARGIAVVCGGWEKCAPDYRRARATFPFLGLEFVAAGSGTLTLLQRAQSLSAGTVFCYGPRTAHRIESAIATPMTKYFVDFIGTRAEAVLTSCGLAPGRAVQVSNVGEVRAAFDALIRLGQQRDTRTERTCALQLEILLHTIARSPAALTTSERQARATFERVRQHIDARFGEFDSLADVAAACRLGASHICHLFRRFHDETPAAYLQRRKMEWAADRLRSSDALAREVADELRMDPFQFSRVFKRVHGVSPSAFMAMQA